MMYMYIYVYIYIYFAFTCIENPMQMTWQQVKNQIQTHSISDFSLKGEGWEFYFLHDFGG